MATKPNQTSKGTEGTLTPEETEEEETSKKSLPVGEGQDQEDDESTEVDYKKKFSESKEGAIKLLHDKQELERKNAELEAKLAKASETSSDDVLSKEIPEWDTLTDGEKVIVRNQTKMDKDIRLMKEKEAWLDDLAKAKSWAKENGYSLAGRDKEFKEFCYSEDNKEIKNIVILAKTFFFDEKVVEEKPVRVGLEKPVGGGKTPPKGGKVTVEEAARLRTTDAKAYKKMLLDKRLKSKDIQE